MFRIGQEEIDAVGRVINSKNLFKCNDGLQETMNCEKEIREKFGCKNVILMTSGEAALISALTALGIGPGDEVIVPGYTYIATALAVVAVGAIPVIADIDETLTIDADDVERKISKYTKAIIPVHMQGFPCNMDKLTSLAKKYNLKIVEDACQADGGSYNGKRLGTIGDAGALSFNYFKIITAGEGGALFTNDRTLYERAYIYHDSGAVAFFGGQLDSITEPQFCGVEYRTNEIPSAILRVQLKRLDGILYDLRRIKKKIMDSLKDDFDFIKSNDAEGDCATTLGFYFETEEKAREFLASEGVKGGLPIDALKHVYVNWKPIFDKRGSFNPLMDPFKMEINKDLNHNYSKDMCKKTLEILSRTVQVWINPDWTDEEVDNLIKTFKNAKK